MGDCHSQIDIELMFFETEIYKKVMFSWERNNIYYYLIIWELFHMIFEYLIWIVSQRIFFEATKIGIGIEIGFGIVILNEWVVWFTWTNE